ncbi:hypothetical protein NEFER03_1008 [Nematocida sp. LUAm3]|nr:hypothetical protein NEFER03_1008 [Nematocida sp. LUAm3]KAI5175388.1 hypothetical protein NEFER02_1317 [Nematocida sp. LUAm2]KAI5177655.1 hypothetical protein NEFER01_0879 [Nematocida sp. LUAm1]
MGFILSRLYKGRPFSLLVLKPHQAKRYTMVEEFFQKILSEYTVQYQMIHEHLAYHRMEFLGNVLSVIEMHNEAGGELFWDCVQKMDGVVYFIENIEDKMINRILEIIGRIKTANKEASLLLVLVSISVTEEKHISFKKRIKTILEKRRYLIVDGSSSFIDPLGLSPKERISQGLLWVFESLPRKTYEHI